MCAYGNNSNAVRTHAVCAVASIFGRMCALCDCEMRLGCIGARVAVYDSVSVSLSLSVPVPVCISVLSV